MKIIRVMKSHVVRVSTEGTNVTDANELIRAAQRNQLNIILGAQSIESEIEGLILDFFTNGNPGLKPAFQSQILSSDWCSVAAKRKLLSFIIEAGNFLPGRERNDLEKLIKDCMSYRNAFTHGNFSTDAETVWLDYFEGRPQRAAITDEYLEKVEKAMLHGYVAIHNIRAKQRGWPEITAESITNPAEFPGSPPLADEPPEDAAPSAAPKP